MNDKKIAFIICVNNELYFEECVWYIERLYIPEGYETDVIGITEAEDMTVAYNAAMESSDAKYKVYMHQDVFIYHRGFIADILKLFQSDAELGLLGVVGGVNLPQDAVIWSEWNRGSVYACSNKDVLTIRYNKEKKDNYVEAEAVDGMLMVTQYDIRWREDLELGWDFYDISQSLEFRRKGYKVGIPFQEKPWCMHDCGYSKLSGYDTAREKILAEYTDFFSEGYTPFYDDEPRQLEEKIFCQMKRSIEQGDFSYAVQIKEAVGKNKIWNNHLQYALNLMDIYLEEGKEADENGSFFKGIFAFEDMKEKYNIVKFLIWHMENDPDSSKAEELSFMIKEKEISPEAVWSIAKHCAVDKEKVCISLFGVETAKKILKESLANLVKNEQEELIAMNQKLNYILVQIKKMPQKEGMALLYNNLWMVTGYLTAVSKMEGEMGKLCSSELLEKAEAMCAKGTSSKELEKHKDEYKWLLEKLIIMTENVKKILY